MEDGTPAAATPAPSAGDATTTSAAAVLANPKGAASDDAIVDAALALHQAEQEAERGAKQAAKEERAAKRAESETDDDEEATTGDEPESPESEVEEPDEEGEETESKGPDDVEELIRNAEIPKDWRATLHELKDINPKVAKEIRDEHYELQAYREQMPLDDVREVRKLFTTAEEANTARLAMGDVYALNTFLKNDPGKFLTYIRDFNPESFPNVVDTFPKWLWKEHPDVFVETIGKPVTNHSLENVKKYGERTGNSLYADAAQVVQEALEEIANQGGGPKEPDDPRIVELEEYKRRDREREQQEVMGASQEFVNTVRGESAKQVRGDITATINRLIPGLKEGARNEIHNRALWAVVQQVMSDKQFTNWVTQTARQSGGDPEIQRRVIGAVLGRAKPLVNQSVADALRWYQGVFGAPVRHRQNEEGESPAAEVGQGAPVGTGNRAKKWSALSDKEKKTMTPDEIIDRYGRGQLTT